MLGQDIERKAYLMDQVVTLDLPMRKVARRLHDAATAKTGTPLCLASAERIASTSDRSDRAFIITGFPVLPKCVAETDGPPGAAVLADALENAGLQPIFITDELCREVVKTSRPKTPVEKLPVDRDAARSVADSLLSKHNPSILISIERPGWNSEQQYHTMRGLSISSLVGKTDYLFQSAHNRGIATIAVGDGGNELGCGTILDTVRKHVPYGAKCQCPCGGGIAAATPADVLVIAAVSNWGGYGIAACFSLLKGLEYKHNTESESELLNRIIRGGAIDSVTTKAEPFVDGVSPAINQVVVGLVQTVFDA
jgi:hypothetical protein